MFAFQLVLGQGTYQEVSGTMLTIRSIDCLFAPAMFGLLVVTFFKVVFKWLSNPILYSSLLSRARIPIHAASITNKTLALSSICLMQFEFPNIEKKMKYSKVFIIMLLPSIYLNGLHPFIHHPIFDILRMDKHKLLFVRWYWKVLATNQAVHISNSGHGE